MKKAIFVLIAAGGLVLAGCCTTHHAAKWEYKTLHANVSDDVVNSAAAEGWSVVGFSASDSGNKWFLLRRPKP